MAGEFGTQLSDVLKKAENNIQNYIWKGPKIVKPSGDYEQEVVRLVDATDDQLIKFANHCKTMLYNEDKKNLGRMPLLKSMEEARRKCGVELFFRESEQKKTTRFTIVNALREMLTKSDTPKVVEDNLRLGRFIDTDADYESLPITMILDGGLDKLGRFDSSHITLNFILRQGVWLSDDEAKEYASLPTAKKLAKIKEEIRLKPDTKLNLNPYTGLTIAELKTALSLRSKKYSDLSTDQLILLRYKLLFALEAQIELHIAQWTDRLEKIEQVAEARGVEL